MKKNFAAVVLIFVAMLFTSGNLYAFDETAKKLFDNGQYDECIHKVASIPGFKTQNGNLMLLAFSNYQLYIFTKQKQYDTDYSAYYDILLEKSVVNDLNSILFFVNSTDKPEVVKAARKLLQNIFANMSKIEDIVKLVPFASSNDKDVREDAFNSMIRIMEPIREVVKSGGTMRPVDLRYFQNKDVIKTAIENVDISAARDTLILIEEPVIEILNTSKIEGAAKVSEKIAREVSDRKKKYPNSSWYSATGKQLKAL